MSKQITPSESTEDELTADPELKENENEVDPEMTEKKKAESGDELYSEGVPKEEIESHAEYIEDYDENIKTEIESNAAYIPEGETGTRGHGIDIEIVAIAEPRHDDPVTALNLSPTDIPCPKKNPEMEDIEIII